MDIKYSHEKILIIAALILCAGILFYNAFFIPDISIPSVIYVDSENNSTDTESSSSTAENNSTSVDGTKININTATEAELSENLTGIGPATAKKIIEYRNSIGKFSSIDDIKNVDGIGEKTFEKFKDMICV